MISYLGFSQQNFAEVPRDFAAWHDTAGQRHSANYAKVAGLLTTASVPAAKRLDFWREVVCHTIAGVEAIALAVEHPYAGAIHARSIPLAHMPSFDLVHVEADPQRVSRTRELISSIQTEPTWLLMIQSEKDLHDTPRQARDDARDGR